MTLCRCPLYVRAGRTVPYPGLRWWLISLIRRWWDKVEAFWAHGTPIRDD